MINKKDFYKKFLMIAVPVAIQNLIISSVNVADVFMIGKLGEEKLAALGLANQIYFLMILLLYGVNSGSGVFMAQFWGKKDIKNLYKVLGIAFMGSFFIGGLFFIGSQLIPETLIRIYSPDPEVIKLGASYMKIVGWSYIITSISMVYITQLRSVGILKLGVYSSSLALVINVFFNYVLIFGKLGFPELGIKGAAIATVTARTIEGIVIVSIVYVKKYPLACKIKEVLIFDGKFTKKFMKTTTPVILNEMFWALGMTTYSMVYARMSTMAVAIINIAGSIERIAFTGFMGIASATAVMIGNKIGEKKEEEALEYANIFAMMALAVGVFTLGLILLIGRPLLNLYSLEKNMYDLSLYTLYVLAILLPFKSFNTTTVVGILRGGGDTKYCLILDIAALWIIGVPIVIYGGLYLGLPVFTVYALAGSEEIIKFIFSIKRIISKKWITNLVEHM